MNVLRGADAIEVRFLRVLVALAEEGTFTDAAIRLGTGQPGVSRTLARFESALGVQLVRRTTRSLTLTPEGRACYAAAIDALAALDSVVAAARGQGRPLRLGYAWAAFGRHTGAILRSWRTLHPDVPLEVHRVDDPGAGLRAGVVDVAVRRDVVHEPGVHVEPLFEEGRLAVVPNGSPLADGRTLTLADLAGRPVALSLTGATTTPDLWPPDAGPSRFVDVANIDEWLMVIASGEALGVTAESTAAQHPHPDVVFVPLPDAPRVTVSLTWPEHGPRHPATADLVAEVRRSVGG